MDYDPGCASPTADEDSEAVFRPPLRGVRKRLDTGSLAGETSKVRSRDTPEYKRITEMIGELVDLRTRIEKGVGAGFSGAAGSGRVPPPEQMRSRVSQAPAGNTDHTVNETGGPKKKKKKRKSRKKSEGTGPDNYPSRNPELTRRPRWDSAPYQPIASGRQMSAVVTSTLQDSKDAWTTVVRRRGKGSGPSAPVESRAQRERPTGVPTKDRRVGPVGTGGRQQQVAASRPVMRKVPKTAAVSILCTTPGQYEAIVAEAKRRIKLPDLGIQKGLKFKRAITGALSLEIPGPDSAKCADMLAERLSILFSAREDVKISRPCKMAELRVRDLDDAVSGWDVSHSLAEVGGCRPSEVTTGTIRKGPNGLGTVWARCPLAAANKIAEAGKIIVGWAVARVQILDTRPLQCFRCLEGGHVKATCNGPDRSTRCYRCGDPGHKAQNCVARPSCPVCTDMGRPANHRAGSKACVPAQRRGRGGTASLAKPPLGASSVSGVDASREPSGKVAKTTTVERAVPRIVEDLTILDPEPLPQRTRSRLSRVPLSGSRPTSPRPRSSMSTEEGGTEDPEIVGGIRDAP